MLESSKTSIRCNGRMGREIKCKRGPRQGDPLSPLSFMLVADGLNTIIGKANEAGLIRGLPVSRNTSIANLEYADGNADIWEDGDREGYSIEMATTYL